MLGGLRQLLFPSEYRIRPAWGSSSPAGLTDQLAELLAAMRDRLAEIELRSRQGASPSDLSLSLAELATSLWRMKGALLGIEASGALPKETRRLSRHLQAAFDALQTAGVEVIDHTGEVLPDQGIVGIKRLSFIPVDGLKHEMVQETVKPTVLFRGKRLQMGEVIVATPKREDPA